MQELISFELDPMLCSCGAEQTSFWPFKPIGLPSFAKTLDLTRCLGHFGMISTPTGATLLPPGISKLLSFGGI
jgi:hypothetical protein